MKKSFEEFVSYMIQNELLRHSHTITTCILNHQDTDIEMKYHQELMNVLHDEEEMNKWYIEYLSM